MNIKNRRLHSGAVHSIHFLPLLPRLLLWFSLLFSCGDCLWYSTHQLQRDHVHRSLPLPQPPILHLPLLLLPQRDFLQVWEPLLHPVHSDWQELLVWEGGRVHHHELPCIERSGDWKQELCDVHFFPIGEWVCVKWIMNRMRSTEDSSVWKGRGIQSVFLCLSRAESGEWEWSEYMMNRLTFSWESGNGNAVFCSVYYSFLL